jgi:hypothetical protein
LPTVTNVNGGTDAARVAKGGTFVLKFNSNVDRGQVPLRRVTIDWGDNSERTNDAGLSIAPRDDPNNPHVYTHTYDCEESSCTYYPKIQIQDSWGWCNDGSRDTGVIGCGTNLSIWTGGVTIVVES